MATTFRHRLAALRQTRRWTQQELAERSGISYMTIYRLERGQHAHPTLETAVVLARALGVSLDVLAGTYEVVEAGEDDDATPLALIGAEGATL